MLQDEPSPPPPTVVDLDDPKRVEALRATGLLDSEPEESFDRLTGLIRRLLGVPVALVSLVDEDRQFFKSAVGLPEPAASERETPLSHSFCQHVVRRDAPLVVEDARAHALVCDNLAVRDLGVIAYLGVPIRDPDGVPLGSLCAIDTSPRSWTDDDVTLLEDLAAFSETEIARRLADEDAASTEARMAKILESIHDAFFALDRAWRFTYANEEAELLLNRGREELLGQTLWDAFPEALDSEFHRRYARAMETGETEAFEAYYPPLEAHFAVKAYPFEGGLSVYFRNVNAERAASEAVEQAYEETAAHERRLRTVIETLHEGLVLASPDGTLSHWNPAALRLLGYGPEEAEDLQRPLEDFAQTFELYTLDGEPLPLEAWPLARALRGESFADLDLCTRITATGQERTISYNGAPVRDPDGAVLLALLTMHDVTTEYEQERALLEANQTLERRVAERTDALTSANRTLTQRNRELQDFAYIASHDLQEPLRKVSAFADLLREEYGEALGEEAGFYLERMQSATRRMSRLINDLLAFSRVLTRGRPFKRTDLGEVLRRVRSDLLIRLGETNGRLDADALPTIEADPTQMYQLLLNLIGNALKFHREGVPPHVHVRHLASNDGSLVTLAIEDNGIGFDAKYTDRIFTPFQRLHGRDAYEGTGIGLAICRRIVERHGGTIRAESMPGEGSRFIITLPHQQGTANAASGTDGRPRPPAEASGDGR